MPALVSGAVLTENTAMATRKKPGHKDRKENRHKHPHVGFNLDERLLALVDAEAEESDRNRSQQLVSIIKAHFKVKGSWPPADGDQIDED